MSPRVPRKKVPSSSWFILSFLLFTLHPSSKCFLSTYSVYARHYSRHQGSFLKPSSDHITALLLCSAAFNDFPWPSVSSRPHTPGTRPPGTRPPACFCSCSFPLWIIPSVVGAVKCPFLSEAATNPAQIPIPALR